MSSIHSYRLACFVLCAALLTHSPTGVFGQDQPTAFVHGMKGDATSWAGTASYLSQRFQISPIVPNLGWTNSYGGQAMALHGSMAGTSGNPAIGNSNGGIVLRTYAEQHGTSGRIDRMAIVGSLHHGAPLADHAVNGYLWSYAVFAATTVWDPIGFYMAHDLDFWDAWYGDSWVMGWAVEFMGSFLGNLSWFVHNAGIWVPPLVGYAVPVLDQMTTYSAHIQGLNESGNLNAEAARLQHRVSLASTIPPSNVLCRTWTTDPELCAIIRDIAKGAAFVMATHYDNHQDWWLKENSYRWWGLYYLLDEIDVDWHVLIGSWNHWSMPPHPQDGILPLYTMRWPGHTDLRERVGPGSDISHFEQREDADMRELYVEVFRDIFGIPERTHPPFPPPDPPPCIPEPPFIQCQV